MPCPSHGRLWPRASLAFMLLLAGLHSAAFAAAEAPDARSILAAAKSATGGEAWDRLRTQHSKVKLSGNQTEGTAERWASILTGRSRMRYQIGRDAAVIGYDGLVPWSEDASGRFRIETDPVTVQLAVNAAYRDRLAFWFPERQAATIQYLRRDSADGATFDVILIVPEGGRAYEIWVDTATHRIQRMREGENDAIRTEVYSDFRDVQGVKIPFTVVAWHGERTQEERYVVQSLEYNVSLEGVNFAPPQR